MVSAASLSAFSITPAGGASPASGVQQARALTGSAQSVSAAGSGGTLRFDPSAPPPTKTLPRGSLLNLSV